jgi:hypothetical protein
MGDRSMVAHHAFARLTAAMITLDRPPHTRRQRRQPHISTGVAAASTHTESAIHGGLRAQLA